MQFVTLPLDTKWQPLLELQLELVIIARVNSLHSSEKDRRKGTTASALAGPGKSVKLATNRPLALTRRPQLGPARLPCTVLLPTSTKAVLPLAPEQEPSLRSAPRWPLHLRSPLSRLLSLPSRPCPPPNVAPLLPAEGLGIRLSVPCNLLVTLASTVGANLTLLPSLDEPLRVTILLTRFNRIRTPPTRCL